MKTYKIYVPKWEVKIDAEDKEEALEIAGEVWDDHKNEDPEFGVFRVKEIK